MNSTAEIRVFANRCEERRSLGLALSNAVSAVYECRRGLDAAQANKELIGDAISALQSAREALMAAQHDYDRHVREHGCLTPVRASAARVP